MLVIRPEQLDALRAATVAEFIRRVFEDARRDGRIAGIAAETLLAAIDDERQRAADYGFVSSSHAEEYIAIALACRFGGVPARAAVERIFERSGVDPAEKLAGARALMRGEPS